METLPPIQSESEEIISTPEIGAEKEAVMEIFREERAGMMQKIFNRKTTEVAALLAPGVDLVALASFAARGETLVGKRLDGRERITYAAIAGFLGLFYALQLSGMHKEALAARGLAAALGGMEFGPDLGKTAQALAEQRLPSIAPLLKKTGDYIGTKIANFKEMQHAMIEFAAGNPNLITSEIDE
jgi:hypothetical protein